jgi:hypothetical protein
MSARVVSLLRLSQSRARHSLDPRLPWLLLDPRQMASASWSSASFAISVGVGASN